MTDPQKYQYGLSINDLELCRWFFAQSQSINKPEPEGYHDRLVIQVGEKAFGEITFNLEHDPDTGFRAVEADNGAFGVTEFYVSCNIVPGETTWQALIPGGVVSIPPNPTFDELTVSKLIERNERLGIKFVYAQQDAAESLFPELPTKNIPNHNAPELTKTYQALADLEVWKDSGDRFQPQFTYSDGKGYSAILDPASLPDFVDMQSVSNRVGELGFSTFALISNALLTAMIDQPSHKTLCLQLNARQAMADMGHVVRKETLPELLPQLERVLNVLPTIYVKTGRQYNYRGEDGDKRRVETEGQFFKIESKDRDSETGLVMFYNIEPGPVLRELAQHPLALAPFGILNVILSIPAGGKPSNTLARRYGFRLLEYFRNNATKRDQTTWRRKTFAQTGQTSNLLESLLTDSAKPARVTDYDHAAWRTLAELKLIKEAPAKFTVPKGRGATWQDDFLNQGITLEMGTAFDVEKFARMRERREAIISKAASRRKSPKQGGK